MKKFFTDKSFKSLSGVIIRNYGTEYIHYMYDQQEKYYSLFSAWTNYEHSGM